MINKALVWSQPNLIFSLTLCTLNFFVPLEIDQIWGNLKKQYDRLQKATEI